MVPVLSLCIFQDLHTQFIYAALTWLYDCRSFNWTECFFIILKTMHNDSWYLTNLLKTRMMTTVIQLQQSWNKICCLCYLFSSPISWLVWEYRSKMGNIVMSRVRLRWCRHMEIKRSTTGGVHVTPWKTRDMYNNVLSYLMKRDTLGRTKLTHVYIMKLSVLS